MKLRIIIFLLAINPLLGMNPTQWFRDGQESIEVEDKLTNATIQAQQKIKKMNEDNLLALAKEATVRLENNVKKGTFFSKHQRGSVQYTQWLYDEIKKLLDLGADPNVRFKTGEVLESRPPQMPSVSLLEIAIPDYPKIVELLLAHGAQPLGLSKAIANDSSEIIKLLVKNGKLNLNKLITGKIRIEVKDARGNVAYTLIGPRDFADDIYTPLERAIELKKPKAFKELINLGANPLIVIAPWDKDLTKLHRTESADDKLTDKMQNAQNEHDKAMYQEMINSYRKL